LLGTFIVGIVSLVFWPEYAGDSLLPRLRKVIDDTLALAPGGASANDENEIDQTNSQTMRILAEILLVADDAQVEGRASLVNHEAIVEAAGTLRRIANRFASIATGRIAISLPQLDLTTEYARETVFVEIKRYLRAWFQFFGSAGKLSASAANAIGRGYSPESVSRPLEQFSSRLEEGQFARVASWTLEQRRTILAELHSMRRLEFLLSELNRWLARIPGH
jgi:hypothetical protein